MEHEWYNIRKLMLTAHSQHGPTRVETWEECRRCGRPRSWEELMQTPCYAVNDSEFREWLHDA